MGNNVTEMVFVLDASGSMKGREKETISDFNIMFEKQKLLDATAYVTTVLFSYSHSFLHDRENISDVKPLMEKDYIVGGGTALLDTVGDMIEHIKHIHKYARKEDVPEKTLFVITTDGLENSSKRYDYYDIKKMIKEQEEKGWRFEFLAEDIESTKMVERMGIDACNYSLFLDEDREHKFEMIEEMILDFRKSK